ncbi:MAG: wax ester/triacylglycerol synthase family O-acyltransferase [Acidimicrobiales bacterium]|nr:wax ester/triacylglycerol synthase family O-acyltransferase [Acidimicrobiales bacterium]
MDRMNPLDATFLHVEDGTTHMHIASCAIFEGPPPPYEELVRLFESKLPLVPRYRQRVRFVPFDLGRPVWVDDPHFTITYHLRHTALPSPGSEADLKNLMARLMSQELDRNRPLWETWVVEGLDGDSWALISKIHHCMVDGVAGADLMAVVLDKDRTPDPTPIDDWRPEPEPSDLDLMRQALVDLVRSPSEQWRLLRSAARAPQRVLDVVRGFRSYGELLVPAPATTLSGPIGPHRRWTYARVTLDDIGVIRRAFGGTVNDVVQSVIAGGFRELVLSRGEDPDEVIMRSLVPVSVRDEEAMGERDNRVSALFLELPIEVADPLDRLAEIRARMERLKGSHETEAGKALTAFAAATPADVAAPLLRLGTRVMQRFPQRGSNTVTTNVPGPRVRLFAAGREMLDYLPFVPLAQGVRVGVAILSYHGRLAFGVTGDFDAAPDIDVLANAIEEQVGALRKLAEAEAAEG